MVGRKWFSAWAGFFSVADQSGSQQVFRFVSAGCMILDDVVKARSPLIPGVLLMVVTGCKTALPKGTVGYNLRRPLTESAMGRSMLRRG